MNYHTDNCQSLLRPKFDPKSVHMGFVVEKATLGQVLFQMPQFSPVSILSPMFRICSSVVDAIKTLLLTLSLINAVMWLLAARHNTGWFKSHVTQVSFVKLFLLFPTSKLCNQIIMNDYKIFLCVENVHLHYMHGLFSPNLLETFVMFQCLY